MEENKKSLEEVLKEFRELETKITEDEKKLEGFYKDKKKEFEEKEKELENSYSNDKKKLDELKNLLEEREKLVYVNLEVNKPKNVGLTDDATIKLTKKSTSSKLINNIKKSIAVIAGAAILGGGIYYVIDNLNKPEPRPTVKTAVTTITQPQIANIEERIGKLEKEREAYLGKLKKETQEYLGPLKKEFEDNLGTFRKVTEDHLGSFEKDEYVGQLQTEESLGDLKTETEEYLGLYKKKVLANESKITENSEYQEESVGKYAPTPKTDKKKDNPTPPLEKIIKDDSGKNENLAQLTLSATQNTPSTAQNVATYIATLTAEQREKIDTITKISLSDERRNAVSDLIKNYNKQDLPALVELSKNNGHAMIREDIITALIEIPESEATTALKEALNDKDYIIPVIAAYGLAKRGDYSGKEIAVKALGYEDPKVRNYSIKTIGLSHDKNYLPKLKEFLNSKDENVKAAAKEAVAELEKIVEKK